MRVVLQLLQLIHLVQHLMDLELGGEELQTPVGISLTVESQHTGFVGLSGQVRKLITISKSPGLHPQEETAVGRNMFVPLQLPSFSAKLDIILKKDAGKHLKSMGTVLVKGEVSSCGGSRPGHHPDSALCDTKVLTSLPPLSDASAC